MKPLDGIRVLDLTRVLAGPYCTALLADLGAEVIKLEPQRGDDYRHIGPFDKGESALFTLNNRGKKSVALDLKNETGLALARKIAKSCDVVVENFRPGVAEKIGLGPEALRKIDPKLVYCSITGFGQTHTHKVIFRPSAVSNSAETSGTSAFSIHTRASSSGSKAAFKPVTSGCAKVRFSSFNPDDESDAAGCGVVPQSIRPGWH